MDDERLKNGGSVLTVEYFDHLLEQIREIRLSERRFYQKITDIYATALDYDRTAKTTKQFFAKVQNKMHYAVHGHTAAELIYERADADKPHMGLTTWAAAPEGKIVKSDVSVAKNYLSEKEMRPLRSDIQMVFQDPYGSLNPRMKVQDLIGEPLLIHTNMSAGERLKKVHELLGTVGLSPSHGERYPHEFSGGQRQRIGIARAIVLEPDLIIADEPISALDVSIQAQVINLLNDLRNKMGLTIMFIAHNLSVVKYFSDRIGVMYYGKLVELADSDELFEHPLHPYTKSLLSAIPYPDPHHEKHRQRIEYKPLKEHDYSVNKPSLREIKPGHFINCNDEEFERYKKELGL